MAIIKVRGVGVGGISEDIPASELPLNMFSYGEDVMFSDGKIENVPNIEPILKGVHGEVQWFSTRYNQTTKEPELVYVGRDSNGDDKLYLIKDTNLPNSDGTEKGVDASRTEPYTKINSTRFARWQGFSTNGVVVVTNGVDIPQVLLPTSDTFIDLPNWEATKRCKAIVPFKGVWVALNIHDSAAPTGQEAKNTMVMWSAPLTDIGTYPPSWEPTDLTGAGFNFLSETGGSVLTGAALQDFFLIYKTDSIVRMDYTGDVLNPFIFRTVNFENGIWSSTSLTQLSDRHFVISSNSIYMTNGIETIPVSDEKIQTELTHLIFENATTEDVIVATDYSQQVINILVKHTVDGAKVTSSYAYNYKQGVWTRRSPVDSYMDYIAFMPMLEADASQTLSWDSNETTWDSIGSSYEETWDAASVRGLVSKVAVIHDSNVYVYGRYRGRTNGMAFKLKKYDIDFDGTQGVDSSFIKTLTNVYPVSARGQGYLVLTVWGHDKAGAVVADSDKKNYVINLEEDYKFDVRVAGRYLSLELSMDADLVANWDSYNFQNTLPKPNSQPLMYLDLSGIDYDISLTQRR